MRIYVVISLFLIPLPIFPVTTDLVKADKELRKKLYGLAYPGFFTRVGRVVVTGCNLAVELFSNNRDVTQRKLRSPKQIDITDQQETEAIDSLTKHQQKLQAKIKLNENPLQAKWKNMARAVVATGVTCGFAYYYLHTIVPHLRNRQAPKVRLDDNPIFKCTITAAQHYYEAPYRPFASVIFSGIFSRLLPIPNLGISYFGTICRYYASRVTQSFIDRLTGFTQFMPSGDHSFSSDNGWRYFCLNYLFFNKPALYVANQFNKAWNYKSDLIRRQQRDQVVLDILKKQQQQQKF